MALSLTAQPHHNMVSFLTAFLCHDMVLFLTALPSHDMVSLLTPIASLRMKSFFFSRQTLGLFQHMIVKLTKKHSVACFVCLLSTSVCLLHLFICYICLLAISVHLLHPFSCYVCSLASSVHLLLPFIHTAHSAHLLSSTLLHSPRSAYSSRSLTPPWLR